MSHKSKNSVIQEWRGIAVLLVFFSHIYSSAAESAGWLSVDAQLGAAMINMGAVGVHLFFMLSGYFVLKSLQGSKSLWHYMKKRLARIYPLFVILTLCVFAFGPLIHSPKWMAGLTPASYLLNLISNLLLLPGIFELPIAQPVTWAISYIFAFYILAGSIYFSYQKIRDYSWAYLPLCLAIVLTALFMTVHPRAIFFIFGVAIYLFNQQLPPHFNIRAAVLLEIALLAGWIAKVPSAGSLLGWGFGILLFTLATRRERALPLSRGRLELIGDMGFSIYLVHPFIMTPLGKLWGKLVFDNPWLGLAAFTLVAFTLTMLVAFGAYRLIEQRFTERYLQRFLNA